MEMEIVIDKEGGDKIISNNEEKPQNPEKNTQNELIENYIKKKCGKVSPTLYIEYTKNTSSHLKIDHEDLNNLLKKFGKISFIEIYQLVAFVQYETFTSAYSCLKYFEKMNTTKPDLNIICRWFEIKDEEIIKNDIIKQIKKLKPGEIVENINKTMKNYYLKKNEKKISSPNSDLIEEEENNIKENIVTDGTMQFEYYVRYALSQKAQKEFYEMVNINKKRGIQNCEQSNNNKDNNISNTNNLNTTNDKNNSNIKYICKFYLKIEADKEFQVAKRIIGAKGSNLKRIIDYCSKGPGGVYISDAVKLKLKGVGSGYKENDGGKMEPLNLCVISKYQDRYKKACSFVIELIINIYGEYKRFCERKGKKPINSLNIQKAEYISTRGY